MLENKKILSTLLIIFLIISIVTFNIKKENNNKKVIVNKGTKWLIPKGDAALIKLYKEKETDTLYTVLDKEEDIYKDSLNHTYINSYKCSFSDCKTYGFNKEKSYVIIKDNDYVIYNYDNNSYKKINLPNANYNSISFLTHNKKDYGLVVSDIYDKYAFYDLKREKFTTKFMFKKILTDETACLLNKNIIVLDENLKYQVINYENDKIMVTNDNYIGTIGNDNMVYYYTKENDGKVMLYNNKLKPLLGNNTYLKYGVSSAGNLALSSDLISFDIFNKNGTFVKKSKPYKNIFIILDNYVVVKDNDDYLKIINYDGNIIHKITLLTDNDKVATESSGLKQINGKNVLYLTVINNLNKKTIYYYNFDNKVLDERVID